MNPNWIWIYTFNTTSTIQNSDVQKLFEYLDDLPCTFEGMAWEFNQFRETCKRNGFLFKNIKRRRKITVEDVT